MRSFFTNKIVYITAFSLMGVALVTGILLPGELLRRRRAAELVQVQSVPEEYYSASFSAMARRASENMTVMERIELVSGYTASVSEEVTADQMSSEAYEMVEQIKERINFLYGEGLAPIEMDSSYGNWYSWTAESYKAVDNTFHTYAAYYWVIHFRKYDGGGTYEVWALDDGTIILIHGQGPQDVLLSDPTQETIKSYYESALVTEQQSAEIFAAYPNLKIASGRAVVYSKYRESVYGIEINDFPRAGIWSISGDVGSNCDLLLGQTDEEYLFTVVPI